MKSLRLKNLLGKKIFYKTLFITLPFLSFFFSLYQLNHQYDGHHHGVMFSVTQDFLNNKVNLYGDMVKEIKPKWYDNKWLWFLGGIFGPPTPSSQSSQVSTVLVLPLLAEVVLLVPRSGRSTT